MSNHRDDDDQLLLELNLARDRGDITAVNHLESLISAREAGRTDSDLQNLLNDPNINAEELRSTLDSVASGLERAAATINARCFETMENHQLTASERKKFGWPTAPAERDLVARARNLRRL